MPNGIRTIHIGRSVAFPGNGAEAHATIATPRVYKELHVTLRRERFDVVQLHSPLTFTLPAFAALMGPSPRIGTFHSYFDGSRTYALFKGVLQREFVARLSGVTVVSPSVQMALSRYFRFDARIIPNGVDLTEFHPDVPRLERFDRGKRTLLFLGRFDPRNGLPFMLKAFERIRRRVDDVRLVVVGSGPHHERFERALPRDIAGDVHFEGPALLERPRYYVTADIFCSPISKASFGITLLEAMASGTPIVATENIGYRDLLGTEEGVLVPYAVEPFADAIVDLLRDDRRRAEMRVAGRRRAEQYAWPAVVSTLIEYFHEILTRC